MYGVSVQATRNLPQINANITDILAYSSYYDHAPNQGPGSLPLDLAVNEQIDQIYSTSNELRISSDKKQFVEYVAGLDTREPRAQFEKTEFIEADIRNPVITKLIAPTRVDTIVHNQIVRRPDQRCLGRRQVLHAVLHGEAVAWGMIAANHIAVAGGHLAAGIAQRIMLHEYTCRPGTAMHVHAADRVIPS